MISKFQIFTLFLVYCNLNIANGFYYNDTPLIEVIKNDNYYKSYYNPLFNQTMSYLNYLAENEGINQHYKTSLKRLILGLNESDLWALKFLESTGKFVNGKLTGRNLNFGSFDHCIEFTKDQTQDIDFDGKYCLVSVHSRETEIIKSLENYKKYQNEVGNRAQHAINFNIGNAHGLCMPSTCSIEEITNVTNKLLKNYGFSILPPKRCTTISEPEPVDRYQVAALCILTVFVFLSLLSLFIKNEFLSNFSIQDNYRAIYHHDPKDNDETRAFLHGVKFLLIMISISLHVMTLLGIFFAHPYGTVKEITFTPLLKSFLKRTYLIADSMFFLGGFFSMYAWYDVVKQGKMKFTFFNFFVLRYCKIVIIAVIIILITFITPHLGQGPLYSDLTNHLYYNCRHNFWQIFALVSNEQRTLDMCIIPSWYLSADAQIYVLNFFVIYYLIVKPKFGLALTFSQMFIVSLLTLIFIHKNNIKIVLNLFDLYVYNGSDFEDMYFHSFYHYNTYVIGIICAWTIKAQVKLKILDIALVRHTISIFAYSTFFAVLYYLNDLELRKIEQNKYLRFVWPVLDKLICNIPPFWMFYSVCNGYSAQSRKAFSLKFFIPWSRLSFSLITIQFTYLVYLLGSSRNVFSYDRISSIKELITAYLFTFILGNFIFIFFENPMTNMLKSYLGLKRRSDVTVSKEKKSL